MTELKRLALEALQKGLAEDDKTHDDTIPEDSSRARHETSASEETSRG